MRWCFAACVLLSVSLIHIVGRSLADDHKDNPPTVTVELQGALHIRSPRAVGNEDGELKKLRVGDRMLLQYHFAKFRPVKWVRVEFYGVGGLSVVDILNTGDGVKSMGGEEKPEADRLYFGVLLKGVRPGNYAVGIVTDQGVVPLVFMVEK